MSWIWIIYWIGYPISFAFWVYFCLSEAAEKKKVLERYRAKDWSTDFQQMDYYSSLWMLALAPFFGSFFWPLMLAFLLVAAVIMSIGWALDKAVLAAGKRPDHRLQESEDG